MFTGIVEEMGAVTAIEKTLAGTRLTILASAVLGDLKVGEAVVSSSSSAFVADSSEFKTLGAGMGMQGTIGDIGHASGPLLAGVLIAHTSYASAFTTIAGLQVAAAGFFWLTMRK